jgi:electron transport complex protein RnfG
MKGFSNMLKLGFILALFATAACVMLAFVYDGTSSIIAQRQQSDLEASLKELFPDADVFKEIKNIQCPDPVVTVESAYAAIKNNKTAGAALRVSRAGYGGPMKILAGVSAEGLVTGVRIMEHSDTPGLGANVASPSYYVDRVKGLTFYGQFAGKKITDPFEVKADVAAVTASTISSRAVADSVKAASIAVKEWLAGAEAAAITEGGAK